MKKSLLAAGVALAFTPLTGMASEVFQLGQIEVVAQARDMLSSAHVNQSTLELNNVQTVNQIAKFVPGVYTNRQGGRGDNNIFVRGFGPSQVPLFVDGIPVYIAYDGTNDLSRYSIFDVSTIDVSKGTGSVFYGPNAMGGAVNIVTMKPSKPFEATVGAGVKTGRNAHTHGEHLYANLGTRQEAWYGALSLSTINDDGMQSPHGYHAHKNHPMDGKRIPNSKHKDYKVQAKVGFTPNDTDEYTLVVSHQHGDKEQPLYGGPIQKFSHQRWWQWPKWDRTMVYALSHTVLDEETDTYVDGKLFYTQFNNDMDSWEGNGPFATPKAYENVISGKASERSTYRDHTVGFGLEGGTTIAERHNLKTSFLVTHDVHKGKKGEQLQAKDADRTITVALEDTFTATDRLTLVGGVSYSHRTPTDTEFYNKNKKKIVNYDVKKTHAVDFQLKSIYQIEDGWDASVGVARKTHFPSMKDRYSERFGKNDANPFLKAEVAYHLDANTTKKWGETAQVQAGLFYSQTRDAIDAIFERVEKVKNKKTGAMEDADVFKNQNVGKVRRYGLELAAFVKPIDNVKLGGNYTYMKAKNVTNKDLHVSNVPEHKFTLWAEYTPIEKLSFYVDQEFQSKFYDQANDKDKMKTVYTTNLKATYNVNKNFTVNAGVSNLFDRKNFFERDYIEEGRTFFANVKYTY